jgi:YbbR domain-containing protein
MKFVALFLASGLWVFVAASMNNVAKFPGSVPVKIVNISPNLTAIYDTKEVSIKLSADPTIWKQLSSDDFSAFVDLNGLSAGTYSLKVMVTANKPNIQVVEVNPDSIMVRIEPILKKEVPISAVLSGQAADGLTIGGVDFTPDKVEVSGPKSVVDTIGSASAEIKLAGDSANFTRTVGLKVLNDKGEAIPDVAINPTEASADVKIVKAGNSRTVGVKVITTGFPASGFYISNIVCDPATVDIIGEDSALRQVQSIETLPIDISNQSDTLAKSIALNLPTGVSLQNDANQKIKVTISFSGSPITKEITASFNNQNLAPGLKVGSLSPSAIKVIVSGPANIINSLSSSDVVLNLDFTGKSTGTVGIDITKDMFKLPAGVSLVSYLPSSISVALTN